MEKTFTKGRTRLGFCLRDKEATVKIGDHVIKVRGYPWPGVIVADFTTKSGERRLVVECTVPEVAGALHIYAPEQLALSDALKSIQ